LDRIAQQYGIPPVGLRVMLAVGPALVIWRMLVVNLWSGLTGRGWLVAVQSILGVILGLQLVQEWLLWKVDEVRTERIRNALPWVAGVAVALKFLLAAWALRVMVRCKEITTATARKLLAVWVVVVAVLFAIVAWAVSSEAVPLYGQALGVVLFVPLGRLLAAPLALAWNRHR
jgi:hypothetical protein